MVAVKAHAGMQMAMQRFLELRADKGEGEGNKAVLLNKVGMPRVTAKHYCSMQERRWCVPPRLTGRGAHAFA